MSFKLPELNYAYTALEPYIDARTMEIHHKVEGVESRPGIEGKKASFSSTLMQIVLLDLVDVAVLEAVADQIAQQRQPVLFVEQRDGSLVAQGFMFGP